MTLWQLIKAEIRSVFTNPVVTLTVFGGVIFYSFLYPLPYTQQTHGSSRLQLLIWMTARPV